MPWLTTCVSLLFLFLDSLPLAEQTQCISWRPDPVDDWMAETWMSGLGSLGTLPSLYCGTCCDASAICFPETTALWSIGD